MASNHQISSLVLAADSSTNETLLARAVDIQLPVTRVCIARPHLAALHCLSTMTEITTCHLYMPQSQVDLSCLSHLGALGNLTLQDGQFEGLVLHPGLTRLVFLTCEVYGARNTVHMTSLRELTISSSCLGKLDWKACTALTKLVVVDWRPYGRVIGWLRSCYVPRFEVRILRMPFLTHLTLEFEEVCDMQPFCNMSCLCSINLVGHETPLPLNLSGMTHLTQLSIQSAFLVEGCDVECVPLVVDVEWCKLFALQSVTISGWAKLHPNVLQLSMLPQLWRFEIDQFVLCDTQTIQLMKELEHTFASCCRNVEVVKQNTSSLSLLKYAATVHA